jgi:hypothetical protein
MQKKEIFQTPPGNQNRVKVPTNRPGGGRRQTGRGGHGKETIPYISEGPKQDKDTDWGQRTKEQDVEPVGGILHAMQRKTDDEPEMKSTDKKGDKQTRREIRKTNKENRSKEMRPWEKGKEKKVEKPEENRKSASSKSTKSHYGRALGASPTNYVRKGWSWA